MRQTLLLLSFLPAFAGLAAAQTNLHPAATAGTLSSLSFTWDNSGGDYIAAISTDSNFLVNTASGTVAVNSAAYAALGQNTTYHFRVKKKLESDASYSPALNNISSSTLVAAPSAPYFISSYFTAESSFTAGAQIGWDTNGNPEWTSYDLVYSDSDVFTYSTSSPKGYPPVALGGLNANTTYYFRVRARGVAGTSTAYTSPDISTATLALKLSSLNNAVYEASATVSWDEVNGGSMAESSEGYRLHLSTTSGDLITPATIYWETNSAAAETVTLSPLTANTTYYYRAGSLNWNGASNLSTTRTFTTLAPPLAGLTRVAMTESTGRLSWTALAADAALGYRLEASSTSFNGTGAVSSATAYSLAQNILTTGGLEANTTYYFRAGSLNLNYDPNYTAPLSSITLANAPSANLTTIVPETDAIIVFLSPLPASPQRSTCEGYRLEASSTAFGGTGVLYFSSTTDPQAGFLSISGLKPNTPYNLRLATLNWSGGANFSVLQSTSTRMPPPPSGPQLAAIRQSSATVYLSGVAGGDSYMVEASTHQFFNFIHQSSATADVGLTTLTVSGLFPNTRYYFRTGALYGGATVYANTAPASQPTLPLPLALDAPPFAGVFYSSVTVAWTPLAATPDSVTAKSYLLEAATAQAFTTVLFSSASAVISADRLALTGLTPNTSYYFRTGTLNEDGAASYTVTLPTSTLANPPLPQDFVLAPFAITLTWLPDSNPSDTLYVAEITDGFAFNDSSSTLLSSATFSGLIPNTLYHTRVTAYNRLNRATPLVNFPDMSTSAYDPVFAAYSDIGVASMTVNWLNGTNPLNVTNYRVQISSNQDFSATVKSSVTLNLYAVFDGLVSNASYYLRVSALNVAGVPTLPAISLGTALTLPATAYILPPLATFTAPMTDGFTVNWANNGNSSHTVYNVQVSTKSDFAALDFSVLDSSLTVRALSAVFKGLQIDTTYFARVQAKGQTGIVSGYETAGSTRTLLYSLLNAVALQDSVISLETSYGFISVHLPRGAIGSSTRLRLEPVYSFAAPISAVSALAPTGIGLSITHFPPTLVLGAITITMPYRIPDLPAAMRSQAERTKLILALFDEIHQVWVPLPSVSDTANNRVIAQTWHLSTFQIMQATPESGLGNVKIYPNPYRPNSVSDVMHFTNMTPYAKVRIYTFLGELVREVRADVNGMAAWDGLNNDGRKAASGIYIAFIQTRDKKGDKSFKVAVER
ncbi:MAG: hypothetical protein A2X35_06370 [Elusimicrobia bacterium GWA2_61_42]|nr:MAG: hypothetical protein A2X35_06370 [Elusimicrobia bacterium GWA2_61_42]